MHAPVWCLPCGAGNGRSAGCDEVDSTNTYVRDQARQGAAEGLVVVADHQTAGRGRLDRRWESPPGANLLASVLLRPECDADRRAPVHGGGGAGGGRRLPGGCRGRAGAQVAQRPARRRAQAGRRPRRGGVLRGHPGRRGGRDRDQRGLAGAGRRRRDLPGRRGRGGAAGGPQGPPRTLAGGARRASAGCSTTPPGGAPWPTRCAGAAPRWARSCGSSLPGEEITGLAAAIDDAGQLVVETAAGPRRVTAGDVVHLRPG